MSSGQGVKCHNAEQLQNAKEQLWCQSYQVHKEMHIQTLSLLLVLSSSLQTANLSPRAPAERPGYASCHSERTRTNPPNASEESHLLPRREVRLVKFLPTLLHFPGNCTNHELIRNNEPAHRGREDNSEQQQRELMEKYILIAQCRQLSLQACTAPREVSLPWEDTRTHKPPTQHRNRRQR